ncbi:efflux RND transporter periplasmic adaptor subunit [Flavihumibacter petaseus]|uniref:Putative RND-type efflux pump membrane fusion protein n=1 Tax=Flavihumibacter petaseus NBRC 106054 TaxID=1220578 RepID=A0A0E9N3A0_9BACT|nr:efflux RND transporter periplasmic adaptor subunit [Flavihumibacter petaseus]GAO43835.1 putative RND-type efflux pump membrane fusion protein [Flavihumibacter petaseus NBRC 106054]
MHYTITTRATLTILVAAMMLFLLAGCKSRKMEETAVAFSMSDTMYRQCAFINAELQQVKNEIRLFGKIATDNNKTAQVYSVLSGVVKSINVGLGDRVSQGQLLAVLQSSEVATFQQEKLDAANDLVIAEKNLRVQQDLFSGKLNSEKDVAAAETELQKAKARLNRINEIYKIYRLKAGSIFDVVAPISGFVVTKNININELLRSDENEPLFSIAEMNEIWAVANVNEADIPRIKENYDVLVNTVAFPDLNYQGKVEKIYSLIDPATKAMKIRVRIPNHDFKLKPDMNCTVNVRYAEPEKKVAVPTSAIIFDKSKYWVMIFKDRQNIETRQVELHSQLNDVTYISSGLAAGETVISKNGLLIYDAIND